MHWLAQTTQPWLWTNVSPEKVTLWIAIWVGVVVGGIIGLFKIVNLLIEQWFGSKALIKKKQREMEKDLDEAKKTIKSLSVVASPSSTPTQSDMEIIDKAANRQDTIDEEK
jgi:hypothetical protein